jgi:protein-L-isoaspartate(D-aspartate) O-methyltransferase
MERLKPLLVDAENRLRDLRISNISLRHGDGVKGWPEAAPFDRIILTCGSAKIPDILLQQLKIDGIMVAPEGTDSAQQLVVITRRESGFEREVLMPVTFVPLIEGC